MNLFLETTHNALRNISNYKKVHVVIGNESCDLDSVVSSLTYAFFLYKQQICVHDDSPDTTLVLPILNIPEDEFPLKTETNYFLSKNQISIVNLSFRDHVDLSKCGNFVLSLVDHHVLADKDAHLSSCVCEIIDHRPVDRLKQVHARERTRIEQVGSCCTLIADMILSEKPDMLSEKMACLLRGTILLDTVNFNKEANRFKDLDLQVVAKLESMFGWEECERNGLYEELVRARSDVSQLSTLQVLLKDMKVVGGIPVPGVPMLVSEFLQREDAPAALRQLCNRCGSAVLIIVGLRASESQGVLREIAVFISNGHKGDTRTYDSLLAVFDGKTHDLDLERIPTSVHGLVLYQQRNVTRSRKHIIPIIETFLLCDTEQPPHPS